MSRIVVSPSEQKHFAEFLRDRTKLLMNSKQRFIDHVHQVNAACKDQRYANFRKKAEETAAKLEEFRRLAMRYSDYLIEKARAGQRYLDGR